MPEFNCSISSIVLTGTTTAQGTPSYQWNTGVIDNGNTWIITSSGTYTVTITDGGNGCTSTSDITVGENLLNPTISLSSDEPEFNCNISSITLTANVTVQGMATYEWSTGVVDNGNTGTIITAGTYTVTVTDDENGCTSEELITIEEDFLNPTAIIVSTETQLYCSVSSIDLDAGTSIGQGTLSYVWDTGETNSLISVSTAGTYTVTITDDENGCTDETSITIIELDPISITELSTSDATCNGSNDGEISILANGGDNMFSYAWNGAAAGSDATASNLPPDIYIVTVTDGLGCTATYSYEVTEPLVISPTVTSTMVDCTGNSTGTGTVSATGGTIAGGYNFAWSTNPIQNTATATGLAAGIYTVTVTDDNNCEATAEVTVDEPLPLTLVISGMNTSCFQGADGEASVVASEGTGTYTYLWSNTPSGQTSSITGLSANTYTVTVTDANGCSETASVVVDEPLGMTLNAFETQIQSDCVFPDGEAEVVAMNGAGGYTYQWDSNAGNQTTAIATGLNAGQYSVTVTDANNCTAVTDATVTGTFTIIPVATITDADCNGASTGSISIVTTGAGNEPFTYDWGTSTDNPYMGLAAGTYPVTITDVNNCSWLGSYEVEEPEPLVITVLDVIPPDCNGFSEGSFIEILVTGGTGPGTYSYTWDGAAVGQDNTVEDVPTGNYVVTVEDANGCQVSELIPVGTPTPITITLGGTTPTNCIACDGGANISAMGGTPPYTYLWNNGNNSPMPTNLCPGMNVVTVTDAHGCTETLNVDVGSISTLFIEDVISMEMSCHNVCDGEAIVVAGGGLSPYTYQWDAIAGGQVTDTITGMCEGTYQVTVTDQNGCEAFGTAIITLPNPLSLELGSIDVVCFGEQNGAITIDSAYGGNAPYLYSMDDEFYTTDTIFENLSTGDYTVYIQDANGCMDSSEVFVYEPTELLIAASPLDTVIDLGVSITLYGVPNQPNTSISWTPEDSLTCTDCATPIVSPLETTSYTVVVTDTINGCEATEEIIVRVNKDRDVYIPNAFSPNNDGYNDYVTVYTGTKDVVEVTAFRIFDRWGEMVFERKNFEPNVPELGWDGYLNGKKMNNAVFVHYAKVLFIDGTEKIYTGDVTLVK